VPCSSLQKVPLNCCEAGARYWDWTSSSELLWWVVAVDAALVASEHPQAFIQQRIRHVYRRQRTAPLPLGPQRGGWRWRVR
jgi:hypothetical protein